MYGLLLFRVVADACDGGSDIDDDGRSRRVRRALKDLTNAPPELDALVAVDEHALDRIVVGHAAERGHGNIVKRNLWV